jgi:hypothetical protein
VIRYGTVAPESLDIDGYFIRTVLKAGLANPRGVMPSEDDYAAYFRGVAHGFSTAITWAIEMLTATQELAVLTRAETVADFVVRPLKSADTMLDSAPQNLVVFRDDSEAPPVKSSD